MGARARDDLPIGLDERVGLTRQGRDFDRECTFKPFRHPRTDGGKTLRDAFERRQAESHLEGRGQQQHDPEHPERDDERAVEAVRLLVDLVGVSGDGDEKPALLAKIDGPLDDAQLLAFGAVDVALPGAAGHPRDAEVGELRQRCIPQRPR